MNSNQNEPRAPLIAPTELLTVPEACDALRISKWSLYRLIQERKLATITIGSRRLVPRRSVDEFIGTLIAEGAAS